MLDILDAQGHKSALSQCLPHPGLCLRQRVVAFGDRLDDGSGRITGVLLRLELNGEVAADNPASLCTKHARHFLAVEGEGAEKAPVLGDQPMTGGGPVKADLGESLERSRHFPRHVQL